MGMSLPRRLASSGATRSNQSSSRSSRYRMAFGKSFGRTVRRGGRPVTASAGLSDEGPPSLSVEKQVGRLVLNGIAAHAEDIAALGIARQSQNLAIGADRYLHHQDQCHCQPNAYQKEYSPKYDID